MPVNQAVVLQRLAIVQVDPKNKKRQWTEEVAAREKLLVSHIRNDLAENGV